MTSAQQRCMSAMLADSGEPRFWRPDHAGGWHVARSLERMGLLQAVGNPLNPQFFVLTDQGRKVAG